MPFTPAHIAAILPFRKWMKSDVFAMMVIGSIIPDMEYFLRFNPASGFSHTIKGVFLFDLPLCILFFYLWKLYIKEVVSITIPFIRKDKTVVNGGGSFIALLFAALFGIATHLIWDAFTHGKGYFVLQSDFLQQQLVLGFFQMKMCYFIWYICSFIGTSWVLFTFFSWKKYNELPHEPISDFWMQVLFSTLMIAVIRIAMGLSHNVPRHLIIILMGAFIYSFLIIGYATFQNYKNKKSTS